MGADWPFIRAILPWAPILIPFTLYKANRLNLLGLSEPVPIGLGVSVEKKGDPVADSGCACSSSCLCHRRHRLRRAQGSALCKSSGRTSKSALPDGSDSDQRLAANTIGRNILEPKGIPAGIRIAIIGAP